MLATSGRMKAATVSPDCATGLARAHAPSLRRVAISLIVAVAARDAAGDAVVGADEAGDEGRGGLVVELLRRAELLEAAAVHDGDVIGQHQRLGLIVGDVDEGGAERGLQLLEFDLHVLAQLQIERAERLVEQQQRRLEHHAARDRDALTLAAGELIDALVSGAGQADALEHGLGAALALGSGRRRAAPDRRRRSRPPTSSGTAPAAGTPY